MNSEPTPQHDPSPSTEPLEIATQFLDKLQRAWNRADGVAFAAPFIETADFINIRGGLYRGRTDIAKGHHIIFNTVYKGSAVRLEALDARLLGPGCILFHSRAKLDVPDGPAKGSIESIQTIVALRAGNSSTDTSESAWQIAAFHNTVVQS